jgi:hypothetical protein
MKKIRRQMLVLGILLFSVPAAGLLYCYFFNQFWAHLDLTGAAHVGQYASDSIRGHRGQQILIHRDFLDVVQRLDTYARMSGVRVVVLHSYRRPRTVLKDAKVRPGQRSNHLAGHALDINVRYRFRLYMFEDLKKASLPSLPLAVQAFIQQLRDDSGVRWGGDFEEEDPVHLDDGLNIRDHQQWQQHADECAREVLSATPTWKRRLRKLAGLITSGEN